MPVEIRELVIQAKVDEQAQKTETENFSVEGNNTKKPVACKLDSEALITELKEWIKEYLANELRGF